MSSILPPVRVFPGAYQTRMYPHYHHAPLDVSILVVLFLVVVGVGWYASSK